MSVPRPTSRMRETSAGPAGGRIVESRARVLRAPVADAIAMSFAPLTHRTMVLVEVETADGLIGRGESWVNYPSWAYRERLPSLRDGVFPLICGRDSDEVESLHEELLARLEPLGRQWGAPGPIRQAISAVDIALWDLRAQRLEESIAGVIGTPARSTVPVYASSLGPGGVRSDGARCVAAGHQAVKVKLGFDRSRDERILADARDACGSLTLYADANQAWTLAEAIAMAPVLRDYDVRWIEEPIKGDTLADLEELHRRTDLVIATGENIYGRDNFAPYAASPAVALLQPDVCKTGGVTEMLAICELASVHGKKVAPHLYGGAVGFAATMQVCAAAAAVSIMEYDIRDNPLRDGTLINPVMPADGVLALPQGQGLGIELDPEAIERFSVEESLCTVS